jgi:hypothetical protein
MGFMITDTGIMKMVVGREYNEKVVIPKPSAIPSTGAPDAL